LRKKILWGSATIIIILLIIYIVNTGKKAKRQDVGLPTGKGVEWMGIYLKGYKVGYVSSKIDTLKEGYRVRSYTYMKITPMSGSENEVKYIVDAKTDKDYNLLSFKFDMFSKGYKFHAEGQKKGKKLNIDFTSEGKKRHLSYDLKTDNVPATIEGIVQFGKTGEFQFFDPTLQSLFTINVTYGGEDVFQGVEIKKYFVEMSGIKIEFWVDKTNSLVRESSPIGLEMIRETEKNAKKITGIPVGLYESYSIKPKKKIPSPRSTKYLKVKIENVDLSGLNINDDRQKLLNNILEIRTTYPRKYDKVTSSLKAYTKPTPFIPCNDKIVVDFAKKIVGKSDGWNAVEKIIDYLYKNIKKKPTFSIPDPLEVIKTMEGDCNEHAALFVALARAIGIPARVEVGVVYVGDGFYYHAWAGVWMGKWVSVDPTFGQHIADATHIKFEEGSFQNQAKLYKIINKLQIEVLNYD